MKRSTIFAASAAALLLPLTAFVWPGSSSAEPGKTTPPKAAKAKPYAEVAASIDKLIAQEWQKQGLEASEESDDAEFLRRVSLDITGQIPSSEEVKAFLTDQAPDKRAKKIDVLLEDPLYAEHWSFMWLERLVGGTKINQVKFESGANFKEWFKTAMADNMPYNTFVYDIVTAEGDIKDNGAGAWAAGMDGVPEDMAGSVSRNFMGVQIQCAQCHDSKINDWKQPEFWGIAAFFARTKVRRVLDMDAKMIKSVEIIDLPRGEVAIPNSNPPIVVLPKYLAGKELTRAGGAGNPVVIKGKNPDKKFIAGPADGVDRRQEFGKWLTADDNKWFAKNEVNRLWAHFLGAGIVDPVEDLDVENSASMPALLDFLTKDFKESGYDVKRMIRVITATKAYQLSSKPTAKNSKDERLYSHAKMEALSPDQMFYSLMAVTGLEDVMSRMNRDQLELVKARFLQGFVFLFGNDENEAGDSFNGTIPQALLLMNNEKINQGLKANPATMLGKILAKVQAPEDRVNEMYLTVLSRYPSETEKKYFVSVIAKYQNSKVIYEDLYWALVNSSEFAFNH